MLTLLYLTLTLTAVSSYQYYQIVIPNGASVPNPCSGGTWAGVGHVDPAGAGSARNAFGEYFAAADHTWTDALCNADSDGDGRSNGEELGDPHCHWKPGSSAHIDPASGHPGICENSDGSVCASDASLC